MLETEEAEYRVTRQQNNYLWLEVLRGGDQGMRVSVPIKHSEYDDQIQQSVQSLEKGDVIEAVLVSEDEQRPNWKIKTLRQHENEVVQTSAHV